MIWLRATYPRLREDQLQRFSWLALIPLSLVQIMAVAIVKVVAGMRRDMANESTDSNGADPDQLKARHGPAACSRASA